jgi:hypothetical protein
MTSPSMRICQAPVSCLPIGESFVSITPALSKPGFFIAVCVPSLAGSIMFASGEIYGACGDGVGSDIFGNTNTLIIRLNTAYLHSPVRTTQREVKRTYLNSSEQVSAFFYCP